MFINLDGKELVFSSNQKVADVTKTGFQMLDWMWEVTERKNGGWFHGVWLVSRVDGKVTSGRAEFLEKTRFGWAEGSVAFGVLPEVLRTCSYHFKLGWMPSNTTASSTVALSGPFPASSRFSLQVLLTKLVSLHLTLLCSFLTGCVCSWPGTSHAGIMWCRPGNLLSFITLIHYIWPFLSHLFLLLSELGPFQESSTAKEDESKRDLYFLIWFCYLFPYEWPVGVVLGGFEDSFQQGVPERQHTCHCWATSGSYQGTMRRKERAQWLSLIERL